MKVKLHNIQGHKNSVFEVHGGLNVIVGSTDSGKSTIIRALKWLVFNRPTGDSLMRNGASKMYVELTTDEGDVVRRERGVVNSYSVNGQVLKAFGTGVPAEVTKVLNLSVHNFKFQHDPFFLLSDSGPERARVLNQFLNLDRMTDTCKKSAGYLREERARLKFLREESLDLNRKIEEEKPIYEAAVKVLEMIDEAEEAEKIVKRHKRANDLLVDLYLLERDGELLLDAVNSMSDDLSECDRLFVRVKRFDVAVGHLTGLEMLQEEGSSLLNQEKVIQWQIDKLDLERCGECGRIRE
jgi:DNA repair exonuclease SbcCD ATPase subunit